MYVAGGSLPSRQKYRDADAPLLPLPSHCFGGAGVGSLSGSCGGPGSVKGAFRYGFLRQPHRRKNTYRPLTGSGPEHTFNSDPPRRDSVQYRKRVFGFRLLWLRRGSLSAPAVPYHTLPKSLARITRVGCSDPGNSWTARLFESGPVSVLGLMPVRVGGTH